MQRGLELTDQLLHSKLLSLNPFWQKYLWTAEIEPFYDYKCDLSAFLSALEGIIVESCSKELHAGALDIQLWSYHYIHSSDVSDHCVS